MFWASHVVYWLPLAFIGFSPWMILPQQSISLVYQFFIHTERVDRLGRPVELVLNTPSHHRVHHGSNDVYLDKNYGGILIVWDRLFGSFQPEVERVRYGLTKNIHPVRVAFHQFAGGRPGRAHGRACRVASAMATRSWLLLLITFAALAARAGFPCRRGLGCGRARSCAMGCRRTCPAC
ncbi:MAG: sterol desaturase family protein [Haloechinothrix sp.]